MSPFENMDWKEIRLVLTSFTFRCKLLLFLSLNINGNHFIWFIIEIPVRGLRGFKDCIRENMMSSWCVLSKMKTGSCRKDVISAVHLGGSLCELCNWHPEIQAQCCAAPTLAAEFGFGNQADLKISMIEVSYFHRHLTQIKHLYSVRGAWVLVTKKTTYENSSNLKF